ncbi:MAG: hypothetical protein R2853_05115 [Thermomicrobiales bacterium]
MALIAHSPTSTEAERLVAKLLEQLHDDEFQDAFYADLEQRVASFEQQYSGVQRRLAAGNPHVSRAQSRDLVASAGERGLSTPLETRACCLAGQVFCNTL